MKQSVVVLLCLGNLFKFKFKNRLMYSNKIQRHVRLVCVVVHLHLV